MTEERAFLKAILEQPDNDALKLVYADWLEEQGDPKAEFLRLMVKVRQEQVVTPEQRQQYQELSSELAALRTQEWRTRRRPHASSPENRERLRRVQELESRLTGLSRQMRRKIPTRLHELAAAFDVHWLAVVSDPEIEGCGKGTGTWRPRFEFLCEQSWADMMATGNDQVRHCETCRQNVYFCDNLADAREHSSQGHCIAVDLGIIRRKDDLSLSPPMYFVGRPSGETIRSSYQENLDPVSQARLAARKKAEGKSGRRQ